MKTLAVNEFEIAEVSSNLTKEEKIKRLVAMYLDDEIKEILGYYDESNPDIEYLNDLEEDSPEFIKALYNEAINNGNFEEAIARNKRLAL